MPTERTPPFIGIIGWKNSGKTTLSCALIAELTQRGLKVASIKHTHHKLQPGKPGSDSVRHSQAGARPSLLIAGDGWAIDEQAQNEQAPAEADILELVETVDLVIVEGNKAAQYPKIEVRRQEAADSKPLCALDSRVFAVVSDFPSEETVLRGFTHGETQAICDLLLNRVGMTNA